MRILGISPLDKDSTVSLMEDGRVVFACGEERLSRVKLQDGFPTRALELGFRRRLQQEIRRCARNDYAAADVDPLLHDHLLPAALLACTLPLAS